MNKSEQNKTEPISITKKSIIVKYDNCYAFKMFFKLCS